jgi:2-dehydropantoate 2-reductase
MKVLVYGAGVVGSVFARHLHGAGNDVSILTRGARLAALREHGLILQNDGSGKLTFCRIRVTDAMGPSEAFDLTIVAASNQQVVNALPALGSRKLGNMLFMVDSTSHCREWTDAVGQDRVLTGFPGVTGTVRNEVVCYELAPRWLQPTAIAELDGHISSRLKELASVFGHAGFPVALCHNIEALQKTHLAILSPLANAVYEVGGSGALLTARQDVARLLVQAVREGLAVLAALKVPITPARLRVVTCIPESLLISALCRWVRTQQFERIVVPHAMTTVCELHTLADEFQKLISLAGVATPAIDQLRAFLPAAAEPQHAAAA